MRVSLITINSLYNYGAVLQCFATFKYLKRLNLNVRVIDYRPKRIGINKPFLKNIFIGLLARTRREKIKKFNKNNLIFTNNCYRSFKDLKEDPPGSDIYIVGSDQVWNSQLSGGKLDPAFFLKFAREKKKISYASSMGRNDIDDNELKIIKKYLEDFSYISVREESAKRLLERVGMKDVETVLDPVFLLKEKDYKKFTKPVKYKKYLLIYSFEKNPVLERLAQKISKKKGLQIIELGAFRSKYPHDKYLRDLGVEEFLSLINYADFILTSSFHGTAFSLLFNKQFISASPSIRKTRLENLVNILGVKERLINKENNYLLNELLKPINYEKVNRLIEVNSDKSKNFLKKSTSVKNIS